jgi:hypothetical protein
MNVAANHIHSSNGIDGGIREYCMRKKTDGIRLPGSSLRDWGETYTLRRKQQHVAGVVFC